jgi:CheY-like chemotaxis protein
MSWKPSALIVEDQPFLGLIAAEILEEAGFETFHAFGAADAVAVLRAHPEIEVLLAEANLSGAVNGVELARIVSREGRKIRTVLTASEQIGSAVPEGIAILRKPYSTADLRALVGAVAVPEDA